MASSSSSSSSLLLPHEAIQQLEQINKDGGVLKHPWHGFLDSVISLEDSISFDLRYVPLDGEELQRALLVEGRAVRIHRIEDAAGVVKALQDCVVKKKALVEDGALVAPPRPSHLHLRFYELKGDDVWRCLALLGKIVQELGVANIIIGIIGKISISKFREALRSEWWRAYTGGLGVYLSEEEEELGEVFRLPGWQLRRLSCGPKAAAAAVGSMPRLERLCVQLESVQLEEELADVLIQNSSGSRIWDLEIDGFKSPIHKIEPLCRALERPSVCGSLIFLTLALVTNCDLGPLFRALQQQPCCMLRYLRLKGWDMLLPAAADSHIPSLTILHLGGRIADHGIVALEWLCELIIKHPSSTKLQHVTLERPYLQPDHLERAERAQSLLIHHLNNNFQCPLETFNTPLSKIETLDTFNTPLSKIETLDVANRYLRQVMERNKAYREGGLSSQQLVTPTAARLFMCGDSGVGKTTITTNLLRRTGFSLCFDLQRHPSTYGIQLQSLHFGKNKLLICDLAGQPEFHSLHHYFMRGSDKELFTITCKAPDAQNTPDSFLSRLRYWLRFIISHRSIASGKPHVIIIVNFFQGRFDKVQESRVLDRKAKHLCQTTMDSYSQQIQFDSIIGLVARRMVGIKRLKQQVNASLTQLLESRPKLPKICKEIIDGIQQHKAQGRIVSLPDLNKLLKAAGNKILADEGLVEVAVQFLHGMGEVIFFKQESEHRYIISDTQWFLQDVIGIFLPRMPRHGETPQNPEPRREEVQSKLIDLECKDAHLQYIINSMCKLGIMMEDPEKDSHYKVLSLLKDDIPPWDTQHSGGHTYWGRRFACKDSSGTLLPSGIFAMLQVELATRFKNAKVGRGWLQLFDSHVIILVKLGGDKGEWYDREWADIFVQIPDEYDLLYKAEELLLEVKHKLLERCGSVDWGCPSIELIEKVIRPEDVRSLKVGEEETTPLDEVLQKAAERNFNGEHHWLHEKYSRFIEITLPGEQDRHMQKLADELQVMQVELDGTPFSPFHHVDEGSSQDSKHSIMTEPTNLKDVVGEIRREIRMSEQRIREDIQETGQKILSAIGKLEVVMKKQMEVIQQQGEDMLKKLQHQLEAIDYPRYPYLTVGDKHMLQKLGGVTSVTVHALCEHGNCHHIPEQAGITMRMPPDWLVKAAPVLVPTLWFIFIATKITMTIYGVSSLAPSPAPLLQVLQSQSFSDFFDMAFGEAIKQVGTQRAQVHASKPATQYELEEFWWTVLKKDGVQLGPRGFNWVEKFGLVKRGDGKFVCKKHSE